MTDLPQIMTRYLDAPAPNPDLSLTGSDDAERWVSEWLDWPPTPERHLDPGRTESG